LASGIGDRGWLCSNFLVFQTTAALCNYRIDCWAGPTLVQSTNSTPLIFQRIRQAPGSMYFGADRCVHRGTFVQQKISRFWSELVVKGGGAAFRGIHNLKALRRHSSVPEQETRPLIPSMLHCLALVKRPYVEDSLRILLLRG